MEPVTKKQNRFLFEFETNSSPSLSFCFFRLDMIETGIKYYEKLLNKNIAIRELSGKDLYSVKGNEYPGTFRMNVYPLTSRKLFFEKALKELRKKEENANNADATPNSADANNTSNGDAAK